MKFTWFKCSCSYNGGVYLVIRPLSGECIKIFVGYKYIVCKVLSLEFFKTLVLNAFGKVIEQCSVNCRIQKNV